MNILVMDIGTSSMRGILFTEDGRRLLERQKKYSPIHKSSEWIEQPAKDWEEGTIQIVSQIAEAAKELHLSIDIISVTAQRSSVIPLDKEGKALLPAVMWQDSRNAEICRRLKQQENLMFERTGADINTVFSGGKMAWIKEERPDIYEKTWKFVNIGEYVMYLMTGEFRTDTTYGSRSNLMDLRKHCWDATLLSIFQLSEDKLCELREPGNVIGQISKRFAGWTGVSSGIPVISAGGDQQCAAVGQGAYREGVLSLVTGTGAFLATASRQVPQVLDKRLICNCAALKGQYILEASVLTCCSAFDWYCRNFYKGEEAPYDKMNQELTELYEKEESCLALPYFQGRSSDWNPKAGALFSNITLSAGRDDLLKSLMEGIFLEISGQMQVMKQYVDLSSVNISGGLTNSRILNQMQADVYGMPLHRMENSESTALGALIVTLVEQGIFETAEQAFACVRQRDKVDIYTANKNKYAGYREKMIEMNTLYQKLYPKMQTAAVENEM